MEPWTSKQKTVLPALGAGACPLVLTSCQ